MLYLLYHEARWCTTNLTTLFSVAPCQVLLGQTLPERFQYNELG